MELYHLTENHLTENNMTENHQRNFLIRLKLTLKLEFIYKLIIMKFFHEYLQIYRYAYL